MASLQTGILEKAQNTYHHSILCSDHKITTIYIINITLTGENWKMVFDLVFIHFRSPCKKIFNLGDNLVVIFSEPLNLR